MKIPLLAGNPSPNKRPRLWAMNRPFANPEIRMEGTEYLANIKPDPFSGAPTVHAGLS